MTTSRRQAGLSLVELMISMTLGLIILSGVLVVFVNSSNARSEVERTSRQIENGRYASELLTEDIRLAGFYGEMKVTPNVPPIPANPCSLDPTHWEQWIPVHLQGFDDSGFTSANCVLGDLKPGTDVLVVRRARACVAGSTGCEGLVPYKPYLQVSLCADTGQADTKKLALWTGTAGGLPPGPSGTFDRQKRNCTTTSLADMRQYLVHVYFISTNNGEGQQIPTLKRLELTAEGTTTKFVTMPLVEGIEEFQLHYGLDTNPRDGVPDVYVANPSTYTGMCNPSDPTGGPTCQADNWMRVVTVQFHLLARNIDPSPNYTDGKTYNLGKKADGTDFLVSPGGAYRRHIYSGLIRVANPSGRNETN